VATSLKQLIQTWEGVAVVSRCDRSTGTWIFICLHDNSLGPSTGGTRMTVYPSPEDGLVDAMRLAEGMTYKWAAAGLEFGGGKAVLALERQLEVAEREPLLRRYGDLVDSLRGAFRTGEDLGTTARDMVVIAERTRHVHGFDQDGTKIDPSPFTARGVYSGIRAALGLIFESAEIRDRTVLVEGVGSVGSRLAELLTTDGAKLLIADLDQGRAEKIANRHGATVVDPGRVASTPCDVYAPCAVGATINRDSIPSLSCRIVAGAANNQLGEPADAQRLNERGILYVPDFVINAGGAIAFAQIDQGAATPEEIHPAVDRIGTSVSELLTEAAERSETPVAAATRRAEVLLSKARESS
jgi:leucine dehydrogenase